MKGSLLHILLFFPLLLQAQEDGTEEGSRFGKGLLRTQGAISPGITLKEGKGIHLHGTLAYRFHERFSVRGDSYFMLQGEDAPPFEPFSSTFSGFAYHLAGSSSLDPYLAFQPGLAYTGSERLDAGESFDPLVSGVLGIKYHAPRVFNVLVETRYLHGKRLGGRGTTPLSGFRFTFGLGLHLNVLKPFWEGSS